MKEQTKIYLLKDPRDLRIMYIGKTTESMSSKMCCHYFHSKKGTTPRDLWIHELTLLNLKPIFDIIEYTENWKTREEYWIRFYKDLNPGICNLSMGPGQLGLKTSVASLALQIKAHSKPVYQLDHSFKIIKLHDSCRSASKILSCCDVNINTAARTKGRCTSQGFIWIYEKDYEEWKNSETRSSYSRNVAYLYYKVKQYNKKGEFIKEWSSITEAAKTLGYKSSGISRAKIGYRKTYKSFIWK